MNATYWLPFHMAQKLKNWNGDRHDYNQLNLMVSSLTGFSWNLNLILVKSLLSTAECNTRVLHLELFHKNCIKQNTCLLWYNFCEKVPNEGHVCYIRQSRVFNFQVCASSIVEIPKTKWLPFRLMLEGIPGIFSPKIL